MKPLEVCLPRPPGEDFVETLRSLLVEGVELRPHEEFGCDVLVEGVPTRDQVEASRDLRAVVVPYAGVPRKTRDLLRDFPAVSLHNLHHNAAPTAEMAMALMLAAAKRVLPADRALRADDWRPRYEARRELLCAGATALVLGLGAIGRRVATACRALGMEVLATRRNADGPERTGGVEVHAPDAVPRLLPRAQAVFVCLPWTPETEGLLGAEELALLSDGTVLVNVARGPIVDEDALFAELSRGRIAAGLDVWYRYPKDEASRASTPPSSHPFRELGNVVMSPHRAGSAAGIEALRARHLAALLNQAARGEPMPNRVDLDQGY